MAWMNPHYLPWLLPVTGALTLSIPLSVLSSRVSWGQGARRCGLFLIPEETSVPAVLQATRRHAHAVLYARGVLGAVMDPAVNALMCAFGIARGQNASGRVKRRRLVEQALRQGLATLTSGQRAALVGDPVALSVLHCAARRDAGAHPSFVFPTVPGRPPMRPIGDQRQDLPASLA
jgi:membrane glycosyltransferase